MANKFLSTSALICASFLLSPVTSQACDTAEHSTLEREKIQLSDLARDGTKASLYNFRTRKCTPLNTAHNELEVSAFLPSDETSLGMYQIYRNKGETQINALKHTLKFIIEEQ